MRKKPFERLRRPRLADDNILRRGSILPVITALPLAARHINPKIGFQAIQPREEIFLRQVRYCILAFIVYLVHELPSNGIAPDHNSFPETRHFRQTIFLVQGDSFHQRLNPL